jgi:hypothetical protein
MPPLNGAETLLATDATKMPRLTALTQDEFNLFTVRGSGRELTATIFPRRFPP